MLDIKSALLVSASILGPAKGTTSGKTCARAVPFPKFQIRTSGMSVIFVVATGMVDCRSWAKALRIGAPP